jgi:membrane associated rhomboid family serine protease
MYNVGFGMRMTPGVKNLILANVAVYLAQIFLPQIARADIFGLVTPDVISKLMIWQVFTYMFLHSTQGIFHILLNMFILWMFGTRLESNMGTKEFLKYYFLAGIAAGIANIFWNWGPVPSITIGASGAVYGLLAAFALFYPDEPIYLYFLFPIRSKYFVLIIAIIEFLSAYGHDGIAHIAHFGGMVAGFFYIRYQYRHWGVGRDFFKDFFKKRDY